MNDTPEPAALTALLSEKVPSDSRQARQLIRRQEIAEVVMSEGSMRIEDLVDRFGISLMTAHRDLDDLVDRGVLRKSRGIVTTAPTSLVEASDSYRKVHQANEKAAIATAAMRFVEPGHSIFLDDSTSVMQMTPLLAQKTPLTVITNSLLMMNELKRVRDITILGLGGQFHAWCNAFMGRMTTNEVGRLRADTLFMSMAAVTDDTAFHQSPEMVETKRAMFDAAGKRILLADHTKFGRRALYAMRALSDFDAVITDEATPTAEVARMRDKGINVIVAPSLI
ncbi:transcriptional regulator, DeoR family [Jannaschia faecimaris]|uniref:Transcriptional regulator, DeoR family n=1 Tax=Jannaschia faecimaris TaxID=1244108 RepID=A0A1H3P5C4_9RHOB|nr:DeoR/GlpR family DNA-binding transcription regulator [Jannaschia faecimaris]SDY96261.1 transcriptional regulator, DeoR family [Jannaschia faecimaris]